MKKLFVSLIAVLLVTIFAMNSFAVGWTEIEGSWYYLDEQGNPVINVFRKSGDYWFYMGEDGRMVKDTWVEHKGNWYYMNSDGAMLASCLTPDGYLLDSEGRWDGKPSIYDTQTANSSQSGGNTQHQGSSSTYTGASEYNFIDDLPFKILISDNFGYATSQFIYFKNTSNLPIIVYSALANNRSTAGWKHNAYLKFCPFKTGNKVTEKVNSVLIQPNEEMFLEFRNVGEVEEIFSQNVSTSFIYEYNGEGYCAIAYAKNNSCSAANIKEMKLDEDVAMYNDINTFRADNWNDAMKAVFNLY